MTGLNDYCLFCTSSDLYCDVCADGYILDAIGYCYECNPDIETCIDCPFETYPVNESCCANSVRFCDLCS